jgi:hypothetical protein
VGFEPTGDVAATMVFKSVRDFLPVSVATWAFSGRAHHVTQDHPAYIPRTLNCSIRHMPSTNLLIGRCPCDCPACFRSVRGLGLAAVRCSRECGELQGRSSMWLPAWLRAAHDIGHRGALVLVINIGPSTGEETSAVPARTPPPNPIAADLRGGRVRSRPASRVHEPRNLTEAVALRP